MKTQKITILGTGRRYSSLDLYSEEFSDASGYERIMLRLSRDQMTSTWGVSTKVYDGFLSIPFTDLWGINIIFGKLIFRKLRKELKDSVIHYTTFGLPILSDNDQDIVTIHDLFFLDPSDEAYGRFLHLSELILRRFRDFGNIIAPSNFVRSELISYGLEGKIKVIYLPPQKGIYFLNNKNEAREALGLPTEKKLILSISSGLRRKNLGLVKEVMQNLGSGTSLVRVGTPLIGAYNFNSIDVSQLNLIYNACDVLLFPSLREGYGRPLVEAMAAGLPIAATNIEVFREICGSAAVLFEPSLREAKRAVEEALASADELRKNGLERSEIFSRNGFIDNVRTYYSNVLK